MSAAYVDHHHWHNLGQTYVCIASQHSKQTPSIILDGNPSPSVPPTLHRHSEPTASKQPTPRQVTTTGKKQKLDLPLDADDVERNICGTACVSDMVMHRRDMS